jgi:hypothetical protein
MSLGTIINISWRPVLTLSHLEGSMLGEANTTHHNYKSEDP